MAKSKSLWENDNVQFTRLLAEMAGVVSISDENMKELCESMDLTEEEIRSIMDRAVEAFEVHKAKLFRRQRR